jgi:hypothetical protein
MNQSIGNDQPKDRQDRNRNGVPDQSERDFKEAGQAQHQPSEQPSGKPAKPVPGKNAPIKQPR